MIPIKNLQQGSPVKLSELDTESKETSPPNRFSEVQLAKVLTDKGIGRPSTLSSIISTIQERGYVVRKGTQLYPTALGFAVARLLREKLPEFVKYEYTAEMEEELDKIADHQQSKISFLKKFWEGKDGFDSHISELLDGGLTLDEIKSLGCIDLHNGYAIKFSKFGVFLEDVNGTPNSKGYLPSVQLDDKEDLWKYKNPIEAKKALEKSSTPTTNKELGTLAEGYYNGWIVFIKDGRFGPYFQAVHPDQHNAEKSGDKTPKNTPAPANQKLPNGVTPENATLEDALPLYSEVRLPRWSKDKLWLVGIGKRGPYMGRKTTAKGRPTFKKLPEGHDPKTISFDTVKELWD